jgi:hypothetical protein
VQQLAGAMPRQTRQRQAGTTASSIASALIRGTSPAPLASAAVTATLVITAPAARMRLVVTPALRTPRKKTSVKTTAPSVVQPALVPATARPRRAGAVTRARWLKSATGLPRIRLTRGLEVKVYTSAAIAWTCRGRQAVVAKPDARLAGWGSIVIQPWSRSGPVDKGIL